MPPAATRTDGVLLVDKPAGVSSHDVVARARRALGERRIGHHGTLDPFATGLLVLLVGRATRLAPYLDGEPKVYRALVRFGTETDTDDHTGAPTRSAPLPEPEAVRAAMERLTGELEQVPPAYSAKQVGGVRAYAAARAGRALALPPARVRVYEWRVESLSATEADVVVTCSGGTYVRALARDLGRLAGSAAHLAALRRLRSGPFDVADAVTWDDLEAARPLPLRSPLPALASCTRVVLDDEARRVVLHGGTVPAAEAGTRAVLLDDAERVVAIAERRGDRWQPRAVLQDA